MRLTETRLTLLAVAAVAIVWATSGRADIPANPGITDSIFSGALGGILGGTAAILYRRGRKLLAALAVFTILLIAGVAAYADGPGAPEIEPPVTVAPPYEPSCDNLHDRIIFKLDCDRPERVETCRAYEQPERANRFVVEQMMNGKRVKRWTWGPGEAAAWRRAEARICGEGGNDHHSP